jgi:hypothetical protein
MILRVMKSLGSTAGGAGESVFEAASLEEQLMNTELGSISRRGWHEQMQHDVLALKVKQNALTCPVPDTDSARL